MSKEIPPSRPGDPELGVGGWGIVFLFAAIGISTLVFVARFLLIGTE